jgi:sugar phosphate isomerase/epimerase
MRSCITVSLVPEARGGPFVFWDDLAASCRAAAELGFDAIEVFPPSAEAIDPEQLGQLLGRYNLNLAAVGTGAGWVRQRLTLTNADAGHRERAIEFVRQIIDLAGPFGASAIIGSMQGRWTEQVDRTRAMDHLRRGLEQLGRAARTYEVPLIYEPLNRYETNLCNTLAAGVELIERMDRELVVLLADLFHMNIEEQDLAAAIRAAGPHIGHVHFVDSNRQAAGAGHLEFGAVAGALRAIDYRGYLSAEALPLPDCTTAARLTIQAFRRYVGEPESTP